MTWYTLACLECGTPGKPLYMPFSSAAERGHWAAGHTRATGHDRWHCPDITEAADGS